MLGLGLGACTAAAARETWTLGAGTLVEARLRDSLSSRGKNAAEALTATVAADVTNERGQVVIPVGSVVGLRIAQYGLVVRRTNNAYPLDATSVTVGGRVYAVSGKVDPVTAPGMEAAVYRPNPDVVVMPGTLILFSLGQPLTVPARYP
jgi:hypothetical protein